MSVDIKHLTAHLSPQQQAAVRKVYRQRAESSTAAFVMCFFLGIFGAHRFYLKQWRQGFLHLLLVVAIALVIAGRFFLNLPDVAVAIVAGILLLLALLWVIVDLVRIDDEVAGHNLTLAEQLIAQTLLADKTVEQQADAKLESMLHETAAAADAAANYGRMQAADVLEEAPSPNDTAVAAPIPAIGAVTGQYVATTITQISDDPNATQHGSHQAAETEAAAQPHTESSVETDTVNDVPAEAALAGVALAPAPLVSEVVTHSHDVAGYSVTDGVETITTASIPEPPLADADAPAALDAALLPTSEEAEAATWPNQLPVESGNSAGGARWIVPDVTDRGEIGGEVKPVADIEAAGTLPLHVALGDEVTPVGAETTADAAEGAALGVAAFASAAPLFADATAAPNDEPFIVAVEAAGASSDASDEGLLFLVPEEAPVAPRSFETPAEAYIPPLVPVVSTPEAYAAPADTAVEPEPAPGASGPAPDVAGAAAPAAFEPVPEPEPVVYEPEPVVYEPVPTPVATQEPQQHNHFGGQNLVELAALSGLSGLANLATSAADEAVSLSRAHRKSLAAEAAAASASATSETPATPAAGAAGAAPVEQFTATEPEQPETLAEFATSSAPAVETVAEPEPVASAEPVVSAEPVAEAAHQAAVASEPAAAAAAEPELVASEPQSEAVPVAVPVAAAAAAGAEALAQHQLKRIRVVRQLKVDGKVVEETAAEEYIDPDADPEPVKERLREQLRQQAEGHANAQGEANG